MRDLLEVAAETVARLLHELRGVTSERGALRVQVDEQGHA